VTRARTLASGPRKAWMARPRRSYELALLRDAALILLAIWVVIVLWAASSP
jgi:hypothetical protein